MRKPLAALTILVATAGIAAAPAQAERVTSSSITVFLKAPDPQGLAALATEQGLTRKQRLHALDTLVPSAGTRSQVASQLRTAGYAITGETTWSVTAKGSTATSARLFGTRDASAARALPRVPTALDASVAAAFPTTGGEPVYRAHRTGDLVGSDYRNAYTAADAAPSTGRKSAGATIATLQLSTFADAMGHEDPKATDLTAYAKRYGLPDPVASKQYQAVNVDGGADGADDYAEVNLDQQSILSTAPTANQHAYFAPNTTAGYNDVFAQVYDDVVGTRMAKLRDPHIVAMSVSWGACESMTEASAILSLEPILQSLTAAGVTVFAASGDDGIYDCGAIDRYTSTAIADVDYPASSPSVVGVGGTHLSARTSKPNTGSNWQETGWTCSDPDGCELYGGGSGGGASGSAYAPGRGVQAWGGFPAPVYQKIGIDTAPFAHNTKRLVPDIATAADPDSGFATVHNGALHSYGGTSLAAPVSAAQLTNALADKGRKTGVGDIHGALYSAYRLTRSLKTTSTAKAFRDITVGHNGLKGDQLTNPSVYAKPGYDTVTGVGAPLWPALVRYLVDTHTPTTRATTFKAAAVTGSKWRQLTARWTVTRGADTSLVSTTYVRITRLGSTKPLYSAYTSASTKTITGSPGATYQVSVVGRDISGRKAPTRIATVRLPLDDKFMPHRAGDGWVRQSGGHDVAGSNIYTTKKGAAATATATGRVYSLRTRTGPTSGTLGVYLRGKLIKKVNQHSTKYGFASTRIYAGTRASRTFTFKALTAKTAHLDALYVTY